MLDVLVVQVVDEMVVLEPAQALQEAALELVLAVTVDLTALIMAEVVEVVDSLEVVVEAVTQVETQGAAAAEMLTCPL